MVHAHGMRETSQVSCYSKCTGVFSVSQVINELLLGIFIAVIATMVAVPVVLWVGVVIKFFVLLVGAVVSALVSTVGYLLGVR